MIYMSHNSRINAFISVEFKLALVDARGIYLQQQLQHYKTACSSFLLTMPL